MKMSKHIWNKKCVLFILRSFQPPVMWKPTMKNRRSLTSSISVT